MQKHAESNEAKLKDSGSISDFKPILDLRNEQCPFTFIKTKLKLEQIGKNETLEVIFSDEKIARDVSKSVQSEGHKTEIVKGNDFWKVIITKS